MVPSNSQWFYLDIGSETDTAALDALGPDRLLPVKPLPDFFAAWPRVLDAACAREGFRLCVVGGGAAGVELVLAAAEALRRSSAKAELALVCSPTSLLADHAERGQHRIDAERLQAHQRSHHEHQPPLAHRGECSVLGWSGGAVHGRRAMNPLPPVDQF